METCIGCRTLRKKPPSMYWCRTDSHGVNELKFLSTNEKGEPIPRVDCPNKVKNK